MDTVDFYDENLVVLFVNSIDVASILNWSHAPFVVIKKFCLKDLFLFQKINMFFSCK